MRGVGSVSEETTWVFFGMHLVLRAAVAAEEELWGFQHRVESLSRAEGMGHQDHLPALSPKGKHWNTHVWSSSL